MLARRRERARLLVLATCRPVELIVNRHPLKRVKQELVARGEATEIPLGFLAARDVQIYVGRRIKGATMASEAGAAIFRRSQGHPLFMVHMADDLERMPESFPDLDCGVLSGGVRGLIDAQLARLAPEQLAALEAASVAGADFAAASVAAAMQEPLESIETTFETLAHHQQFIEARGLAEWDDGTVCGRYGFRHDIYRDALYRRLGAARRVRLHASIGRRLSEGFGDRCADIAGELASHFENARDGRRAAHHFREAAEKALQRYAYREALALTGKGLALLSSQVDDSTHRAVELKLHLTQGLALLATRGYGSPEVEATYTRALALGIDLDDSDAIGPALSGLYNLYLTRAAFGRVGEIADKVLEIVGRRPQPVLSMLAHNVRGSMLLFVGCAAASLDHVDRTLALYDPHAHRLLAATYGEDPALACHHYAALAQWIMGFPETAERHLAAGFELARSLAHPFGEAQMLWMDAVIGLDDGDLDRADRATLRLQAICVDHEFPLWLAGGQIMRGAVLAARGEVAEGAALNAQGLRAWQESGTLLTLPHALAAAARVQAIAGQGDEALLLMAQAISTARRTGERWYEPELLRLQGELMLASPTAGPAEVQQAQGTFQASIDLARQQRARLLELRSCVSLASTWLSEGRTAAARKILLQVRAGFTEGLQSRDMERADALLARMPSA
jgi:predicted ATPase